MARIQRRPGASSIPRFDVAAETWVILIRRPRLECDEDNGWFEKVRRSRRRNLRRQAPKESDGRANRTVLASSPHCFRLLVGNSLLHDTDGNEPTAGRKTTASHKVEPLQCYACPISTDGSRANLLAAHFARYCGIHLDSPDGHSPWRDYQQLVNAFAKYRPVER